MEIFLSVIAVMAALSCLGMLLVSDAKDYMKQAAVKLQSSEVEEC